MNEKWVLEIKNQCAAEGVAFFFKQWGGRTAKSGGRQLNGIEHNAMPVHFREESERVLQMAS